MNTCIKCGKPIADGELFCAECGLNPSQLPQDGQTVRRPQAQGRMQAPVRQARSTQPVHAQPVAVRTRPSRGTTAALLIVSVLAALFLGLSVYQFVTAGTRRTEMRVREAQLSEREAALDGMQEQNDLLTQSLAEAQTAIDEQNSQIKRLNARVEAAESAANQSQYDADTQLAELERVTREKAELSQTLEEAEAENQQLSESVDALTASVQELTQKNSALGEKAGFMDTYVVFVENDKTGLYHRYDCASFAKKSFWAYSRKLAESNGYKPCPSCMTR